MTKVITALGVALLGATPVLAQSGFLLLGGQFGHVEDLGTVLSGERIEVTVVMAQASDAAELCPVKSTIFLVESNDADGTQMQVERTEAESVTVVLDEALFTGEGVFVLQTQDENDDCVGYLSISIGPPFDG